MQASSLPLSSAPVSGFGASNYPAATQKLGGLAQGTEQRLSDGSQPAIHLGRCRSAGVWARPPESLMSLVWGRTWAWGKSTGHCNGQPKSRLLV